MKEVLIQEKGIEGNNNSKDLATQERELFFNIEKSRGELSEEDFQLILNRLFEHSVDDALKFLNQLNLSRDQFAKALVKPLFFIKHPKIASCLFSEISSNEKYIERGELLDTMKEGGNNFKKIEKKGSAISDEYYHQQDEYKQASYQVKKYIDKIDDYYSVFFDVQKDVKLEESGEKFKNDLVLDQIFSSKLALENHYYSGEILKILFKNLIHEDSKKISKIAEEQFKNNSDLQVKYNSDFSRYFSALERGSAPNRDIVLEYLKQNKALVREIKNNNLLDQETVNSIVEQYDLGDVINKNRVDRAKYKPLGLVYNFRKELIEKKIINKIQESLKRRFSGRDLKIILDPESGSYVVDGLDDKNNESLDKKESNIETVLYTFSNRIRFSLEEFNIINNQFYFKAKEAGRQFVIGPNGEKIGSDYDWVCPPKDINSQVYFTAQEAEKHFIIGPNGEKIGGDYDFVGEPREINNQVYFRAQEAEKHFIIGPNGEKIGGDYDLVYEPKDINNQVYFRAQEAEKWFVIGPNGEKIGGGYDYVSDPKDINNQVYFKAKEAGRQFIIGPNGEKIGGDYDWVGEPREINNQVYFQSQEAGRQFIIGPNGEKIGGDYDLVYEPKDINNQVYFRAQEAEKWFVIGPNGEKIGGDYDSVYDLKDINNQVYFQAKEAGKWFVIGPNGEKIGGGYDYVSDPKDINNQVYFKAKEAKKQFIIGPNGEKIGGDYDWVGEPREINNQVYFQSQEAEREFVIGPNGEKIGGDYDSVYDLKDINNQVYFQAKEAEREFVIGPNGEKIGGDYDSVYDLKDINNQVYFQSQEAEREFVIGPNGEKIGGKFNRIMELISKENDPYLYIYGAKDGKIIEKKILIDSKNEESGGLSDFEKEQLDLLNLIHSPSIEGVNNYLNKNVKNNNRLDFLSSGQLQSLNSVLNSDKKLKIDTFSAKVDRFPSKVATRLLFQLFPEILIKKEREKKEKNNFWAKRGFLGGGFGGKAEGKNQEKGQAGGFIDRSSSRQEANTYEGGGFSEKGRIPEKILSSREKIEYMMVNNIFGKYDNNWKKIDFRLSNEISLPSKEISVTLHSVGNTANISLPKPLESRIIPERVKGIKESGEEISLNVSVNSLGEAVVIDSYNVKEIVYSFKISEFFEPLEDLKKESYNKFISSLEYKEDLTEDISDLSEYLNIFIKSIENKSPKEKVLAIENYVKNNGYYDKDNQEISDLKKGKSIDEIIYVMELRAQELQENDKNKNQKKYAGVCADFAILTTALLRKAGIASGYLKGYNFDDDKTATENGSHGCSFVLWPNKNGQSRIIKVDGTPMGSGASIGFSLEAKENQSKQEKKQAQEKALEEVEKIKEVLSSRDEAEISKLSNGQLETVLNNTLKYAVNHNNLKVIETVLQSYWYSPIKKSDDNTEITKFLKDEIESLKLKEDKNGDFFIGEAGSQLFSLSEDFVKRFSERKTDTESLKRGLGILEKVYDLSKDILNDVESKSLLLTIQYLKAKNIQGVS